VKGGKRGGIANVQGEWGHSTNIEAQSAKKSVHGGGLGEGLRSRIERKKSWGFEEGDQKHRKTKT